MTKLKYIAYSRVAAALVFSSAAFAQIDIQLRVRQQPGWDPRAREGRCEVRVWVDHLAELRIRGDGISVRTMEGARSYDEGSACSHPLPYNSIRDFQIRQIAGRNRVNLVQEPNRMNNYTALLSINDDQGGGAERECIFIQVLRSVTYWDNPLSHIRTEFGFDVLQVATGRYAPDRYRSRCGCR